MCTTAVKVLHAGKLGNVGMMEAFSLSFQVSEWEYQTRLQFECVSFYKAPQVQTPLAITSGSESRPIFIILILISREYTSQVVLQTDGRVFLILVR